MLITVLDALVYPAPPSITAIDTVPVAKVTRLATAEAFVPPPPINEIVVLAALM